MRYEKIYFIMINDFMNPFNPHTFSSLDLIVHPCDSPNFDTITDQTRGNSQPARSGTPQSQHFSQSSRQSKVIILILATSYIQ